MKKQIILAALLAGATLGVNAQTTTPTTTNNQTTNNGATTTQQGNNAANRPYASQTNYNTLAESRVPENIRSTFGTSYAGVTETKWQGNGKDYRTSFKRDGRDMSVTYDMNGKMTETRTSMNMTDLPMSVQTQLKGKNANMPYEVKMGNNTYYWTQVSGKDMYYDKNGKLMDKAPIK